MAEFYLAVLVWRPCYYTCWVKMLAVKKAYFSMVNAWLCCYYYFPNWFLPTVKKWPVRKRKQWNQYVNMFLTTFEHKTGQNSALNLMTAPYYSGCLSLTHLDMCFGLVEQSQCGVPTAVWSQRDQGLQPLQTQAKMCSSVGGDTIKNGQFSLETACME